MHLNQKHRHRPGRQPLAVLMMVFCIFLLPTCLFASDAQEFAFYLEATNKYFGIYEYTNNAPILILNSKATLLVDAPRTFRIGFLQKGITIPYGPFSFTNGAPIQIGKYLFTLITRGLFDVREKLTQQAAEGEAFKGAQRAKGLTEWNGAWVSSNALCAAQAKEKAFLLPAEKRAAAKRVQAWALYNRGRKS